MEMCEHVWGEVRPPGWGGGEGLGPVHTLGSPRPGSLDTLKKWATAPEPACPIITHPRDLLAQRILGPARVLPI